ncbi:MAG: hypothetical protein EBZ24_09595 [Synechococcaceae bacterium WB9_4xB_025]|jgi:hypothetical protein|nr:hypothetical protein [Synechococcaceae bacterium WB9_4xB_025]
MEGKAWSVTTEEVRQVETLLRKLICDPITEASGLAELKTLDAAARSLGELATVMEREARILAVVNDPSFRGGLAGFLQVAEAAKVNA